MGAVFASASSQRLINSVTPISALPITMAGWVNPVAGSATAIAFAIADVATANNYYRVGQIVTSNQWLISAADGVGTTNTGVGTVIPAAWSFLVARFISATNRRLAILHPDGSTSHGQGTASRVAGGLDRMSIGDYEASTPSSFWNGGIAEFWITNTDIQADGAQLNDSTLRQLAYGGPFSVPHIVNDIIEYRSLRTALTSNSDDPREVYSASLGSQTWTNTNGAIVGAHPPLPYWYVKPGQVQRQLVI